MSGVVTARAIVWNTTAGNKTTASFQPAAGELLVAIVGIATSDTAPTFTDTDTSITGWTLVDSFRSYTSSSTGGLRIYCSNQGASGSSITVTMQPTADAGGGIAILSVTGANAFGSSAVRSNGGQADQASGTPAPVLSSTPLSVNPIIVAVMTNTNGSANASVRSSYSEHYDQGFNTPPSGIEVQSINSGETSATLTTGGAAASAFASIGIEINTAKLGEITSTNTAKYAGTLGAEVSTSTYNATTLGAALSTDAYP